MHGAVTLALVSALLGGCGLGLRHRLTEGTPFARAIRQPCGHLLSESYTYAPRVVGAHQVATREGGCWRGAERGGCSSSSREAHFADDPDRYFFLTGISLEEALPIARAYLANRIEGETGLGEFDHFNGVHRRDGRIVLEFDQCDSSGSETIVEPVEREGATWLRVARPAELTWEE